MTNIKELSDLCERYLKTLCIDIPERCVGSDGNRTATGFFNDQMKSFGWKTEIHKFSAMDWLDGGAELKADGNNFIVNVSPYSLGISEEAELVSASNILKLQNLNFTGKILFLRGDIAKEQLMPKNFVFYNPEEHQRIISLIEKGKPKAVICATSRNAALAGGVYPFPLIEDGDFDIPSVYMTEEEGERLKPYIGKIVALQSKSKRIFGKGYNVIGRKGIEGSDRVVITAHIDAKKGTPGALDNATGVTILLLLARLLKSYSAAKEIELVALNGEDYYAVPGQMDYVRSNENKFGNIILNINVDGAGYKEGASAFSLFGLSDNLRQSALAVINESPNIVEGALWPQGDHSIFVQYGRPAIAVSSKWFIDNIDNQDITHTPKDNLDVVDSDKVVELALAINSLIMKIL